MKVKWQGFAGSNHSWAHTAQAICKALDKKGHEVHLISTNGYEYFPDNLRHLIKETAEKTYDCQLSYTAMKNFPTYLSNGSNNRFGIWCYEFAGKNALPDGFAKYHKFCDMILPPSNFAKQIFIDSGVPESKLTTVSHGVDFEQIESAEPFKLKTKKNTKIGIIVGQVHRRKNLPNMLDMFGKAFNKQDDICLVIKVQDKAPTQQFELSFTDILKKFFIKYPNHAEVEVIRQFVPNIYSIYKACDIIFYTTNCEGFGLISLEALACGNINIASNYGGVLDFCDKDNSLLVEGKEFITPANYLYWSNKYKTISFMPDIDDGVDKLRFAFNNKNMLLEKNKLLINDLKLKYNWSVIVDKILGLIQNV